MARLRTWCLSNLATPHRSRCVGLLEEAEGFEPSCRLIVDHLVSSERPSATRAHFHVSHRGLADAEGVEPSCRLVTDALLSREAA